VKSNKPNNIFEVIGDESMIVRKKTICHTSMSFNESTFQIKKLDKRNGTTVYSK
jgi:hypothetical protein